MIDLIFHREAEGQHGVESNSPGFILWAQGSGADAPSGLNSFN